MTPRQRKFVQEYLKDPNATKAAIKAGYSKKTAGKIGSENLQKPEIRAALEVVQAKVAEKAGLTAEWVLEQLQADRQFAMGLERPQTGSAIRALELIGKQIGMFVDKSEVVNTGVITVKFVRE